MRLNFIIKGQSNASHPPRPLKNVTVCLNKGNGLFSGALNKLEFSTE